MIVSISQPAYLPWLGYFHRIALSDLHISLNDVEIGHRSFTNRNKVLTPQGPSWLTVPVVARGGRALISEIAIARDVKWRRKHWGTIQQSYAGAEYFDRYADFWELIFRWEWELLEDLIRETTAHQLEALGIDTPLQRSSEMTAGSAKSDLILDLCSEADADVYLSGALGRNYLDERKFEREGIRIEYVDYTHPSYPQVGAGAQSEFVSHLATIDALFNCGPGARQVLMSGNEK